MPKAGKTTETEVKLAVPSVEDAKRRLRRAGFRVLHTRVFEANEIFDTPELRLRANSELLRLREAGGAAILTYKGPPLRSRHKSREEVETKVSNPGALRRILLATGFTLVFRYEKYRTEYVRAGEAGHATVDETPLGCYMELEGDGAWIDATAGLLGFTPADYITLSYGSLYVEWCGREGITPQNMVFGAQGRRGARKLK